MERVLRQIEQPLQQFLCALPVLALNGRFGGPQDLLDFGIMRRAAVDEVALSCATAVRSVSSVDGPHPARSLRPRSEELLEKLLKRLGVHIGRLLLNGGSLCGRRLLFHLGCIRFGLFCDRLGLLDL